MQLPTEEFEPATRGSQVLASYYLPGNCSNEWDRQGASTPTPRMASYYFSGSKPEE
jgi:hypothetical protein